MIALRRRQPASARRGACRAWPGLAPGLVAAMLLAGAPPAADAADPPAAPATQATARAPAALLDEATARLRRADPHGAYELLAPALPKYAGDPRFDYLLGLAALDSGRIGDAVMALERVLMVRPDHLQARAELGRAYLAGGETENARQVLETVAGQRIPESARNVIGRYLDAIAKVQARARTRVGARVVVEAGYDDNVNFGSAVGTWLLADGTAVTPLPVSRPNRSAVFGISGAIDMDGPINGPWRWTAGVRGGYRDHPGAHTLDQEQFDLSAGLSRSGGCHQFVLLGQYQNLRLDAAAFRDALGVLAQWQCDFSQRLRGGLVAQRFRLRYPNEPVRDARRDALGASIAYVLRADTVAVGAITIGRETPDSGLPNLAFDFAGVRAAIDFPLSTPWRASLGLNREDRRFGGPEPLFGVTRNDRQTELRIAAQRPLGRHWTLTPQLSFTRNRSTLAPNDFRRTSFTVVASYRF